MTSQDNLLGRLHRLASSQDENFLTESLAYLLHRLIAVEPAAALSILNKITNGKLSDLQDTRYAEVFTQVSTDSGRPDL